MDKERRGCLGQISLIFYKKKAQLVDIPRLQRDVVKLKKSGCLTEGQVEFLRRSGQMSNAEEAFNRAGLNQVNELAHSLSVPELTVLLTETLVERHGTKEQKEWFRKNV